MMPNEKPDMNDIEIALKKDDYCEGMREIGFTILYFDEDSETDCYFMSLDRDCIIHFDFANKEFWTYPKANNKSFAEERENVKNG